MQDGKDSAKKAQMLDWPLRLEHRQQRSLVGMEDG